MARLRRFTARPFRVQGAGHPGPAGSGERLRQACHLERRRGGRLALLPALVPARSMACSMVSVVRTPKITGTPVSSATLADPLGRLAGDESKCGVEPRITAPRQITASYLPLPPAAWPPAASRSARHPTRSIVVVGARRGGAVRRAAPSRSRSAMKLVEARHHEGELQPLGVQLSFEIRHFGTSLSDRPL